MKKTTLRNFVFFVMLLTMTVVFSVPALAADQASGSQSGKKDSGILDDLSSDKIYSSENVRTTISGTDKKISVLKYSPSKPTDKIKINHGQGRDVYVEQYKNGEWQKIRTYKAGKGNSTKKINIDFSSSDYKKKTVKWRVRVPEVTVTEKERVHGAVVTKKITYKAAAKSTKTVVTKFTWPLKGRKHISSRFGTRICPFHGAEFHGGVDIPAPTGTKVRAAADGVVVSAHQVPSFGKRIIIRHGKKKVATWYNHLSRIQVKKGQKVKNGQIIGRVGSTGDSTGPHLDFRIKIKGKFRNPCKYAKRR